MAIKKEGKQLYQITKASMRWKYVKPVGLAMHSCRQKVKGNSNVFCEGIGENFNLKEHIPGIKASAGYTTEILVLF